MCQFPGKDSILNLDNANNTSLTTISMPSMSAIRTMGNCYEMNNVNYSGLHEYSWIPTDMLDSTF
jgi:hypothetical protein